MRTLNPLLAAIAVVVVATGAFVYSGAYDIGADGRHWRLTERMFATLRERSIQAHARRIERPDLDDAQLVARGAKHYAAMCADCHRAPGCDESEMRSGLYPQPPDLSKGEAPNPGEAFWVIKHGIKMSAMPAWGASHADDAIWALVAFITRLPRLSPAEYRALTDATGVECGHPPSRDAHMRDDSAIHEDDR